MEVQAFEVQICAQAETRGLLRAFLVNLARAIASLISQFFQSKTIEIEKTLDNPTFKRMDALRKMIQSLVDYVLNSYFCTHAI